jgi:hypothetical protein
MSATTRTLSQAAVTRIAADLSRAARGRSGARLSPYHRRALEVAARADGWDGRDNGLPLEEWMRRRYPAPVAALPAPVVERITTGVMSAWMRSGQMPREKKQPLLRALAGVAAARGTCEGKPLGLWMLDRARSTALSDRKAIAEAVEVMSSVPAMAGDVRAALAAELEDPNRLIRVRACAAILRLTATLPDAAGLRASLVRSLGSLDVLNLRLSQRTPPPPVDSRSLDGCIEDARGNHVDGFAWAAAVATILALGAPKGEKELLDPLRDGLRSPLWLVRDVAAAALKEAGGAASAMHAAQALLASEKQSLQQEGLRKLRALAPYASLTDQAVAAVLHLAAAGDLRVRAAAIEALGSIGRAEPRRARQVSAALQEVARGPLRILQPLGRSAMKEIESSSAGRFHTVEAIRQVITGRATVRPLPPKPLVDPKEPPLYAVCFVSFWNDSSPLGVESAATRLKGMETAVRECATFSGPLLGWVRDKDAMTVFLRDAHAALAGAETVAGITIGQASCRAGIHLGEGAALRLGPEAAWTLEGDLAPAARTLCDHARPGQTILSEPAMEAFAANPVLARRLDLQQRVNLPGAVDVPIYAVIPPPAPDVVREASRGGPHQVYILRDQRPIALFMKRCSAALSQAVRALAVLALLVGLGFSAFFVATHLRERSGNFLPPQADAGPRPAGGKAMRSKKNVRGMSWHDEKGPLQPDFPRAPDLPESPESTEPLEESKTPEETETPAIPPSRTPEKPVAAGPERPSRLPEVFATDENGRRLKPAARHERLLESDTSRDLTTQTVWLRVAAKGWEVRSARIYYDYDSWDDMTDPGNKQPFGVNGRTIKVVVTYRVAGQDKDEPPMVRVFALPPP